MEITKLATIPSTSTLVSEQIKAGKSAPFAVIASEQSGGRGRRGRTWSSPLGGIYLSIAFPPPAIDTALIGNLSLWVGMEISRWLEQRLGFKIALKWPNDLMFDGRKLGGILIESGIEGQKQGAIIVGIGINCAELPAFEPSAADTLPITLSEICKEGSRLVPTDLAQDLIQHVEKAWNAPDFVSSLKHVEKEFLRWSPPATRLWIDKDLNEYWWLKDIFKDGSVSLSQIGSSQEKILHSANHSLTVAKKNDSLPVLLADVGNTAVKICGYKSFWDEEPFFKIRHMHAERDFSALKAGFADVMRQMPAVGWPLFISGVAPRQIEILQTIATVAGFLPIELQKKTVRVHGSYPLEQIGFDRLCLMEGWLSTAPKIDDIAVIASFGTAVTVDVVKGSGLHLGGIIAPGLQLSAMALHEYTGLLPLVTVSDFAQKNFIGLSSQEAIGAGILNASVGLIDKMMRDTAMKEGIAEDHLTLLVSGGDGELIKTYLSHAQLLPDLLFQGLKSIVAGGVFARGN